MHDAVIEVEDLVFRYPGGTKPAVSGVTFAVTPGEVFGLLGPSGAGKSTLQKVLTRQHRRLERGSVRVLGKPIGAWGSEYYERIGVGFELPNHFARLTVAENLAFFASLYTRPVQSPTALLERVGLGPSRDVRVSELSKGMMMRLSFVRALMHAPELVFLDEPTSGLDPVNAEIVRDIVRELQHSGTTVVLTTHNMSDVEALCERVGFMVGGEMKALDHRATLKARYGRREVVVAYGPETAPRSGTFALDGLARDPAFLALLDGGDVRSLHSQEASLDRVFAEVTGTALSASEAAGGARP